jgi:hypothetical protein
MLACSERVAWAKRGAASVQALYADTGALSADASANNLPGVAKADRKLASDAIAAAALPLPPVDPGSWKTFTADYAVAGTAIAGGDASGAVPHLEEGNSAISASPPRPGSARARAALGGWPGRHARIAVGRRRPGQRIGRSHGSSLASFGL